jgi:antirestriction protein
MMTTTVQPRVYVACLAAYNSGILHGKWIDADQDIDDLWADIAEVLKSSPIPGAEEWAVHDHEYMGNLGEYPGAERIVAIGQAVAEHGEAYLAWLDIVDDPETEDFTEQYVGSGYDSEKDYCYEIVDELGLGGISPGKYVAKGDYSGRSEVNVLEALNGYLDWDTIAREYFDHGPYTLRDGHVFRAY